MKVLLTGANWQPALATVRCLGEAGAEVDVVGGGRLEQSLYSRYCHRRLIYPNPAMSPRAFSEQLHSWVKKESYDALLPCDEHSAVLLSNRLESFRQYVPVPVPVSYTHLTLPTN